VLARFDRELRIDPPVFDGVRVEHDGPVVRLVGVENIVLYAALDASNARRVVAEQVAYFRSQGVEFEWKRYGHDRPAEMEEILAAEKFVPDEPETLVVYDLTQGTPGAPPGPGVEVREVQTRDQLKDAWEANRVAFEGEDPWAFERWERLWQDPTQRFVVAYVEGTAACSGRLDLARDRSFAGLFGGGTVPQFRNRGAYRATVAARATIARDLGYRYVTVDARETSRPILEKLGFVPLTTTRAWVRRPDA